MDDKYIKYKHYGNGQEVWVRSDLKDKAREYSLCWACIKFNPSPMVGEHSCNIYNTVNSLSKLQNLVLPIMECPEFEEAV